MQVCIGVGDNLPLDLKFLNEGNTRMKKGIRCRIQFAGAVGWQAYRGRHEPENLWNWIGFMLGAQFGFPSSRFPTNGFSTTRLIDFTTRFAIWALLNDRLCQLFTSGEKQVSYGWFFLNFSLQLLTSNIF